MLYLVLSKDIVSCQAHRALVKKGQVFVPSFIFDSMLARIHVVYLIIVCQVRTSPLLYGLKG